MAENETQWLSAEQAQEMVSQAVNSALEQHSVNSSASVTSEQIQEQISKALATQDEKHAKEIARLMESIRGNVLTFIAEHGGGPGTEIADTWSQFEQHRAYLADEADRALSTRTATEKDPPAETRGYRDSETLFPAVR
jgi:hypothetical protein